MRIWSIPAGRLFGADIRIHVSFLILLAAVWFNETQASGTPAFGRAFSLVGIVFASVVLHELGHALAAAHQNLPPRAIVLLPLGGISVLEEPAREKPAVAREFRIAVAGPAVNLFLGLVFAGVLTGLGAAALWTYPLISGANLPRSAVWINLFLAVFNLLPAYPTDGGRILRAVLARRMDLTRATRRAVGVGQAVAVLFLGAGFVWNSWLALVGLFLFMAAQLEERSAVFHSVLQAVRLEEIMLTDFSTLSPADTLEDALHKAVHTLQDDFPVVRGSDMVGVISKQKILDALRSNGNGYVQSAMNRVFSVSQRGETLAAAFRKLTSQGISVLPVVDGEHLVGIITLQNLMHSMSLLAESRKLKQQDEG